MPVSPAVPGNCFSATDAPDARPGATGGGNSTGTWPQGSGGRRPNVRPHDGIGGLAAVITLSLRQTQHLRLHLRLRQQQPDDRRGPAASTAQQRSSGPAERHLEALLDTG